MDRQPQLQVVLDALVVPEGGRAYFNPPDSIRMVYPAIVYKLDFEEVKRADNINYFRKKRWLLEFISKDPIDSIREKIADLPQCSFERMFPADGLTHQIFNLYY